MERVLEEQENKVFIRAVDSMASSSNKTSSNIYSNTTNISQLSINHHHHHQHQQTTASSRMLQNDQQNQDSHQQISLEMMQASSSSSMIHNFANKDSGAYDFAELDDQSLFLYLHGQEPLPIQEQNQNIGTRLPTLNIFPSQPMHVEPSPTKASSSTSTSFSKRSSEPSMELPKIEGSSRPEPTDSSVKRQGNRKDPTSSFEQGLRSSDPKTLRRLAQNREAARKSRLRKKAYIQQLESSRMKLTQVEQEIHRARAQGAYLGGNGGEQGMSIPMGNMSSSDAVVFDMEYARWVEEHHRLMNELRNAVQDIIPENDLRLYVENCLGHYDELFNLKNMIAKSDVFYLFSGMWKTPAERCFMWMGGFRPSKLIKILISQIESLTEQQVVGICGLQQSTEEAEEALTQGHEAMNQSLSETIVSDTLSYTPPNYMSTMALAINKLSTLQGFLRQAENLRHETIHRLPQFLTISQAARCFLAIAEYFHRLRALSSLWLGRPKPE